MSRRQELLVADLRKRINIVDFQQYRDGGTISVTVAIDGGLGLEQHKFYFDYRLGITALQRGAMWYGYPGEPDSIRMGYDDARLVVHALKIMHERLTHIVDVISPKVEAL